MMFDSWMFVVRNNTNNTKYCYYKYNNNLLLPGVAIDGWVFVCYFRTVWLSYA